MPMVMINDEAVQYPRTFGECDHDQVDHHWTVEPWTDKEHHEAHCMNCGADTVIVHEVDWDIDHDGAPVATIVVATWRGPRLAE